MQIFHNDNIHNNIFYIIVFSSTSFHKKLSGISNVKLNSWKVIPTFSARPRCRAVSDVTGGCWTTKQEDKGKVRKERCLGTFLRVCLRRPRKARRRLTGTEAEVEPASDRAKEGKEPGSCQS